MSGSKHTGEIVFYLITIIICIIAILFLFKLLKYDDCKYVNETNLKFHEGEIVDLREARGTLYIWFEAYPNMEFKVEISSLTNKTEFENLLSKNEEFKVGYSLNTMYKDISEIVCLECNDTILVSAESRKNSVTTNLIMYIGAIVLLFILAIYLLVSMLR